MMVMMMVMMMTTRQQRCINKEQGRGRLLHFRWTRTWTAPEGKVMILIINYLICNSLGDCYRWTAPRGQSND